jgi:hypothetical protein
MPRSSTGSQPDLPRGAAVLAAGATTEAGIVRTTVNTNTRNRLLAIAVFGVVLFAATFIGVSAFRKGDINNNTSKSHALTADPSPPPPSQTTPPPPTKIAETASPPHVEPTNSAVVPPHPPTTTTKIAGRPPITTKTSPSSRPPLPSATTAPTPPPTPTGHDIF